MKYYCDRDKQKLRLTKVREVCNRKQCPSLMKTFIKGVRTYCYPGALKPRGCKT